MLMKNDTVIKKRHNNASQPWNNENKYLILTPQI